MLPKFVAVEICLRNEKKGEIEMALVDVRTHEKFDCMIFKHLKKPDHVRECLHTYKRILMRCGVF